MTDPILMWHNIDTPSVFSDTPPFFQWLIGQYPPTHLQCEIIKEEIEDGKLLACSDRSYNPNIGTASHAWIFASEVQPNISSGAGPNDGHPTYCLLTSQNWDKSTVTQSRKPNPVGITPFLTSDYDLLGAIRDILSVMPIKLVCE